MTPPDGRIVFIASFHTGVNFIEKSECGAMVRFVRVTYVRRGLDDSSETPSTATAADYWPPKGFSYKTFVPSPVKVAMCSGAPVYDDDDDDDDTAHLSTRVSRRPGNEHVSGFVLSVSFHADCRCCVMTVHTAINRIQYIITHKAACSSVCFIHYKTKIHAQSIKNARLSARSAFKQTPHVCTV